MYLRMLNWRLKSATVSNSETMPESSMREEFQRFRVDFKDIKEKERERWR